MMAADRGQLETAVALDDAAKAELIEALRPYLDKAARLSRRSQALLAAAGEAADGKRWYVLRVAPRSDKAVDNSLALAGIDRWMPVEKRAWKRPHSQKLWVQDMPFLSGYVFVRVFSCDEIWSGLMAVKGVLGVLCGARGPLACDDEKFMRFKAMQSKVEDDVKAYSKLFHKGERVMIDVGPYASFSGEMEADADSDIGRVLIWIFGRQAPVSVPLAALRKSS